MMCTHGLANIHLPSPHCAVLLQPPATRLLAVHSLAPTSARHAGQNNQTIYVTVASITNSASPAINGTVAVRALSTSDRANNLPGTLLGTVIINTCEAADYPNSPSNGCYGSILLPATLSADIYTFVGQYSGAQPCWPCWHRMCRLLADMCSLVQAARPACRAVSKYMTASSPCLQVITGSRARAAHRLQWPSHRCVQHCCFTQFVRSPCMPC